MEIWNHYVQPKLSPGNPLFMFESIFHNHLWVIKMFGRFPHRNNILGRESTKEEEDFLQNPAFRFDLPLIYKEDGTVVFQENEDFRKKETRVQKKKEEIFQCK